MHDPSLLFTPQYSIVLLLRKYYVLSPPPHILSFPERHVLRFPQTTNPDFFATIFSPCQSDLIPAESWPVSYSLSPFAQFASRQSGLTVSSISSALSPLTIIIVTQRRKKRKGKRKPETLTGKQRHYRQLGIVVTEQWFFSLSLPRVETWNRQWSSGREMSCFFYYEDTTCDYILLIQHF